ncbi:MAG: nucleoside deaminase [Opitutales bacterium]|nr:nucleoside deaminase [Opitutales bacterium]MBR7106704.1 nucleoside deaminase [Opitutales bacterium]
MSENAKEYPEKTIPECPFEPLFPSYLVRDDEFFMKLAYNQALKAWKLGEVPVGAVIEYGGEVIAQAHNTVEQSQDPTAHAEILAITQASAKIGDWRLNGATLYVTKEPCPMCSGASIMARLSRVVYAVPDSKMGFLGGALSTHEVPTLNHHLQITQGVLQDECLELIKTYFALKR